MRGVLVESLARSGPTGHTFIRLIRTVSRARGSALREGYATTSVCEEAVGSRPRARGIDAGASAEILTGEREGALFPA